jgi:hypothetical protein
MTDLSVHQVADQLLMTHHGVRYWINRGDLDARRNAAGEFRITPEALARFRHARKMAPHGMARFWEGVRELRRAAAA